MSSISLLFHILLVLFTVLASVSTEFWLFTNQCSQYINSLQTSYFWFLPYIFLKWGMWYVTYFGAWIEETNPAHTQGMHRQLQKRYQYEKVSIWKAHELSSYLCEIKKMKLWIFIRDLKDKIPYRKKELIQ